MVSVKEKEVGKSSSKDDEEWEDECEDEGENLSSSQQTANKKKKINRNKNLWKIKLLFSEINLLSDETEKRFKTTKKCVLQLIQDIITR